MLHYMNPLFKDKIVNIYQLNLLSFIIVWVQDLDRLLAIGRKDWKLEKRQKIVGIKKFSEPFAVGLVVDKFTPSVHY